MAKKSVSLPVFTPMSKEEFVFLQSVTSNFTTEPTKGYNDIHCPVPTPGFSVKYKNGKHSWADENQKIRIK